MNLYQPSKEDVDNEQLPFKDIQATSPIQRVGPRRAGMRQHPPLGSGSCVWAGVSLGYEVQASSASIAVYKRSPSGLLASVVRSAMSGQTACCVGCSIVMCRRMSSPSIGRIAAQRATGENTDWPTLKPDTSSAWYMELAAMRFLSETGHWASVDELWQACLLPSLCVCKQGGAYFMVLSVEADIGAVLWPMCKSGEALWFDMREALRPAMVPDIEEWMV